MSPNPLFPRGEGAMQVRLDKKALFALASDTRLDILRALQPMRRTVTQLAEAVSVDKAAVHRHLQKLVEGELVKRYDDHGFVYYGLSWKARDLLAPNENTKVIILLGSSITSGIGAGIALLLTALALQPRTQAPPFTSGEGSGAPGLRAPAPLEQFSQASPPLVWPIMAGVLVALALVTFFFMWRALRRPKQTRTTPEGTAA